MKQGWRLLGTLFNSSWLYQIFMFGLCFGIWSSIYFPTLWLYQYDNRNRTYEACMIKERAHKKKLRDQELAEEEAENAATAASSSQEE